jgi:hypothetical protein
MKAFSKDFLCHAMDALMKLISPYTYGKVPKSRLKSHLNREKPGRRGDGQPPPSLWCVK